MDEAEDEHHGGTPAAEFSQNRFSMAMKAMLNAMAISTHWPGTENQPIKRESQRERMGQSEERHLEQKRPEAARQEKQPEDEQDVIRPVRAGCGEAEREVMRDRGGDQ
jgi:hypothetical protein